MNAWDGAKIALGVITRDILDPSPFQRFLDNARSYGHSVDRLIIAYSHRLDERVVEELESRVRLDVLCVHKPSTLEYRLSRLGLEMDQVAGLLSVPSWPIYQEIPYGSYRNAVLLHAILERVDFLLFFDTDVLPRVLTDISGDAPVWEDVDVIGTHMRALTREDVSATTSEYSGYYIIPPVSFEGFSDLLYGLGKGMALEYMDDCQVHHCLNLGPPRPGIPVPTDKPLGGNLGLNLDNFWRLAPFFSTIYQYKDLCVKGRGEDTLLGQALTSSDGMILDVDLRVFHDTYVGFPSVPDIHRETIRNRFYWACLGWIGRNPFMSWYLNRIGRLETSFDNEIGLQKMSLEVGGEAASEYLKDERFRDLPAALEASYAALPAAIDRFERLVDGWTTLIRSLIRGKPSLEIGDDEDQWLPLAS
jgi:hypothetical protein